MNHFKLYAMNKEQKDHLIEKVKEMRRFQRRAYIKSKFEQDKQDCEVAARLLGRDIDLFVALMGLREEKHHLLTPEQLADLIHIDTVGVAKTKKKQIRDFYYSPIFAAVITFITKEGLFTEFVDHLLSYKPLKKSNHGKANKKEGNKAGNQKRVLPATKKPV